jgi:phage terminase small subunit
MNAKAALSPKYLIDRNGAAAAVRAGYSARTARSIAHELLTKPDVAAMVAEGERAAADRLGLTREKVLARSSCDGLASLALCGKCLG